MYFTFIYFIKVVPKYYPETLIFFMKQSFILYFLYFICNHFQIDELKHKFPNCKCVEYLRIAYSPVGGANKTGIERLLHIFPVKIDAHFI